MAYRCPPRIRTRGDSTLGSCGNRLLAWRHDREGGGAGLAGGWAISDIGDQVREAAMAAADEAGMPVGAWVEQALRQAVEAKA